MSRLVTFGCSYTYGTGLPDCPDGASTHSKYGWASLLSNKMNLELVNVSSPAASNFEIIHNILDFEFDKNDTVVIMWTHYARDLYFRKWFAKKWPRDRIGSWSSYGSIVRKLIDPSVSIGSKWIENMNDKTFAYKSWAHIHHATLYLKSKDLNYLHFPANASELLEYPLSYEIDNFCTDGILTVDRCEDGHPGIESNKLTAESIYKKLNETFK